MEIVKAIEATKMIDDVKILSQLSFSINRGDRIAITGHNGSGKSSLLKLIGGIYEATSGEVSRVHLKIAYVPEHFPDSVRFKLYEYLMLIGKMNGRSKTEIHEEIMGYAKHFAVSNFLSTPLKKCSKGTKQKAGIIQALLKKPDLLLMDEPLTGLDDHSQKELIHQLHQLAPETTIIFTAHESLLVDELAQRIIRVERGRIISDILQENKERLFFIKARIPSQQCLTEIPFVQHKFIHDHVVEMVTTELESDEALRLLLERGCSIQEVKEMR